MTEERRLRYKLYRLDRMERKFQRGECKRCPQPATPGRTMCPRCADLQNIYGMTRYTRATTTIRHCSTCRRAGHTRTTCARRGA